MDGMQIRTHLQYEVLFKIYLKVAAKSRIVEFSNDYSTLHY